MANITATAGRVNFDLTADDHTVITFPRKFQTFSIERLGGGDVHFSYGGPGDEAAADDDNSLTIAGAITGYSNLYTDQRINSIRVISTADTTIQIYGIY